MVVARDVVVVVMVVVVVAVVVVDLHLIALIDIYSIYRCTD